MCPRTSLANFTKKHALALQDYLARKNVSPYTQKKVKKRSLLDIEFYLRILFNHAIHRGIIDDNPFRYIKIPNIKNKSSQEHGYVPESEIERITYIDETALSKMSIVAKYKYLLPRVMLRICYAKRLKNN